MVMDCVEAAVSACPLFLRLVAAFSGLRQTAAPTFYFFFLFLFLLEKN
jgi:hypothetical protein